MKLSHSFYLKTAGVALAALGAAGAAQARGDVYWSVGVHAAPGVTIGVGNARPVYYAPAPVYVAPAPVYYAPQPVYYVRPAPVYYSTGYYYGPTTYVRVGKHRHRHHHRH